MSRAPAHRVVVTGIGAVSTWGWGVAKLWDGLCGDRAGIGPFHRFDNDAYPTHIAGQVPEIPVEPDRRFPGSGRLSLADRFALFSANEAAATADFDGDVSPHDLSVFFGSSTGGMFEAEELYLGLAGRPLERDAVFAFSTQFVSAPGDAIARELRAAGPVETISSACSSATLSIGLALDALRCGRTAIALGGGADSLCRTTYSGFNALRAVAETPCTPFARERSGLSLGEGAGALVLETLEHAIARGATPLAELAGMGVSADAHHMTAPHPEGRGIARALSIALDDAGVDPAEVDFINAHGTGTRLNDASEYRALDAVFGDRAGEVAVTSTKGSIGHLLGSAGAVEAVATVLCLDRQHVHPTPGAGSVDPEAPVRLVRGQGLKDTRIEIGASLNLGFGGTNGALVFKRWRGE